MQHPDFYSMYGFSPTEDLEQIQSIVRQKIRDEENDSFSKGHADRMQLLQVAMEAFSSQVTKLKYDQDLEDSLKHDDPLGERRASFEKWYSVTLSHYGKAEFDLAKKAIEEAMRFGANDEVADDGFYSVAASICRGLKNYPLALEYINKSILLAAKKSQRYYEKANILYAPMLDARQKEFTMQYDVWFAIKSAYEQAISIGLDESGNSLLYVAFSYQSLAQIYYSYADGKTYGLVHFCDNELAEKYAKDALSFIDEGNRKALSYSQSILDDISERRRVISVAERQNRELHESINQKKLSINHVTYYGDVEYGVSTTYSGIAGIIGIILIAAGGGGIGLLFILISISVVLLKTKSIQHNMRVRDVLASIKADENDIRNNDRLISYNDLNRSM